MSNVMVNVLAVKPSPLNARRWQLALECGHDLWLTSATRPRARRARCAECAGDDVVMRDYLRILVGHEDGPKCECKSSHPLRPSGAWVVAHAGKFYTFNPQTQLQKDIWLGAMKRTIGEERAIAMLRWWCFGCGTIQSP